MPLATPEVTVTEDTLLSACYHCGEDCQADSIHFDDKSFCCQGCKMVYEILNTNDLCAYYSIDEKAGISLKGKKTEQYLYLDDEDVAARLYDFKDAQKTKVRFYLPAIHCASCIWLLENLWKLNDGIERSQVNFPRKEISITFLNAHTTLRKTAELLAALGYAPAINLGSLEDSAKKKPIDRSFYYKLGIAGFAFGNIMLLSFPEYLGLERGSDLFFTRLFGYLNILLSLPVLLYSGSDYLRSAISSLRFSQLNLDVPIALGILALFGRSVYEILTETGAGYLDSFAGLIFFLLIGKWFQQRTYHNLSFERDYKSYFPVSATLEAGGAEQQVSLDKLKEGDYIIIRNGELIPADGILMKGDANIDYSFVTGESEPVNCTKGDKIFAGGRQMGSTIHLQLVKKVSQSYLTSLWNDEAFISSEKPATSRLADLIGRRFTIVVLTIAFGTLLFWLPKDAGIAFTAFTSVLIIACPCAVALSIPFTFGNIIRLLSRNHFYLKNIQVIESLKETTAVVFDKTGTLTGSEKNAVEYAGPSLSGEEEMMVYALASHSTHPLSRQIAGFFDFRNNRLPVLDFIEITGLGIQGKINGIEIKIGSGKFILRKQEKEKPVAKVYISIDGEVKTGLNFRNGFRTGATEVLDYFGKRYQTFLLSGDNDAERPVFEKYFKHPSSLHFNQAPQDKLDFVKVLQQKGEKVLMIGDGLNDAGALRKSETGIVVTENTNNFTPASDAILRADQFSRLPAFLEFAKSGVKLVHWSYVLAFCYNIVGLSYAVTGTLSPVVAAILMPASSITIVLFGVGLSNLLARKRGIR